MEQHLSEGEALALSQMKNGSRLRTSQGSLTIQGLVDFMNPNALVPPPLLSSLTHCIIEPHYGWVTALQCHLVG